MNVVLCLYLLLTFEFNCLLEKANTDVFLHWVDEKSISAKIVTEEETYYIEVGGLVVS